MGRIIHNWLRPCGCRLGEPTTSASTAAKLLRPCMCDAVITREIGYIPNCGEPVKTESLLETSNCLPYVPSNPYFYADKYCDAIDLYLNGPRRDDAYEFMKRQRDNVGKIRAVA